MSFTLTQPAEMLACLYVGLALGAAYDLTRALCFGGGMVRTAFADGLFWCLALGLCLFSLYRINGLDLRLFQLVFFGLGFALYKASFSPLLRWIARKARDIFLWVFTRLSHLLR